MLLLTLSKSCSLLDNFHLVFGAHSLVKVREFRWKLGGIGREVAGGRVTIPTVFEVLRSGGGVERYRLETETTSF